MPSRFFVTGTDTGVGKTVVSALLCAALNAIYWKPIQTGSCEGTDRKTVMKLAGLSRDRTIHEAYEFVPPISPHLAAARAGVRINLGTIRLPRLAPKDKLIVEGAGGVLVPINERDLMSDLMKNLELPVVLVSRTALGTINHTLLSLAALCAKKIDVRGVVMVGRANEDNRKAIERYGETHVIGWIPKLARIDKQALVTVFRKYFNRKAFGA